MSKVIRSVIAIFCYGSGLSGDKGLLWWHPAVILFTLITLVLVVAQGIWETLKEVVKAMKSNTWRTIP